jgi:hypothetical protein
VLKDAHAYDGWFVQLRAVLGAGECGGRWVHAHVMAGVCMHMWWCVLMYEMAGASACGDWCVQVCVVVCADVCDGWWVQVREMAGGCRCV